MNSDNEKRIRLGMPLDLLFDRDDNILSRMEKLAKEPPTRLSEMGDNLKGALKLPTLKDPGTGNIIIRGRPGTGKSILALQMAQKCCEFNLDDKDEKKQSYFTWFVSLEETPDDIEAKAKSFGWEKDIFQIRSLNDHDEMSKPEDYGNILIDILTLNDKEYTNCLISRSDITVDESEIYAKHNHSEGHNPDNTGDGKVYVSSLSPRHLTAGPNEKYDIFEDRFSQIENLLSGAKWLKEQKEINDEQKRWNGPELAMVCIDSLNVFGDKLLTREQIYRLFGLFKRYEVIGVFILEEDEGNVVSPDSRLHGDMIEHLADVVISMQYNEKSDYFLRFFEIVKSRYQHQIYGKHPFRINKLNPGQKQEASICNRYLTPTRHGIVIYPSLHYIVFGTDSGDDKDKEEKTQNSPKTSKKQNRFDLGFRNAEKLLPMFSEKTKVALIEGPPGTFKETISTNYLIKGLAAGENALLINLQDQTSCDPTTDDIRISKQVRDMFVHELATSVSCLIDENKNKDFLTIAKEIIDVKKIVNSALTNYVSKWNEDKKDRAAYLSMQQCINELLDMDGPIDNLTSKLEMIGKIVSNAEDELKDKIDIINANRQSGDLIKSSMCGEIERHFDELLKNIDGNNDNSIKIHYHSGMMVENYLLLFLNVYEKLNKNNEEQIGEIEEEIKSDIRNQKNSDLNLNDYFKSCFFRRTSTESTKKKIERFAFKNFIKTDKEDRNISYLTEIAFTSGYIQPEEFIQEVRDILISEERKGHKIKRIVFSDIGLIGVSYPLLEDSQTAGGLFLTALSHIVRNYGDLQLVMAGTTEQYDKADEIISKARSLADAVLKCSFCDVFGNRYVVIDGEGLIVGKNEEQSENSISTTPDYGRYLPGVIIPEFPAQKSIFSVNLDILEGLVGFGTGNLHRPGILFHAFEDGDSHKKYNRSIQDTLSFGLGLQSLRKYGQSDIELSLRQDILDDRKVLVDSYYTQNTYALHDGLKLFKGKPRKNTIINTIDEFFLSSNQKGSNNPNYVKDAFVPIGEMSCFLKKTVEEKKRKKVEIIINRSKYADSYDSVKEYIWPYYSNVLLMAYRVKDDKGKDFSDKINISKFINFPGQATGETSKEESFFSKCKSWDAAYELACKIRKWLGKQPKNKRPPKKRPLFEYYHHVDETMACLLLDVAYSTNRNPSDDLLELFLEKPEDEQINQYIKLHELLNSSNKLREVPGREYCSFEEEKDEINANACVFACWYSQLRELVKMHPNISDKLRVCALPGGGFTGDWFLGISKGSVSIEFGKEIIKELTKPDEQFKRLLHGVGLPVIHEFCEEESYRAWDSTEEVWLKNIYEIHERANSRSMIRNYHQLRAQLVSKCRQLMNNCDTDRDKSEYIRVILERLARRLRNGVY